MFFCHDAARTTRQCPSLSLLANTTVAGAAGQWFVGRGTPEVRLPEQSSHAAVVATLQLAMAVAVAVTVAVAVAMAVTVAMAVAAAIAMAVIWCVAVAVVLGVVN